MVELPAAVAMVDALLPLVDFVALGTNDLLQYGLAVDRGDPDSSDWAKPYEPYLLRSVNHVLEHARSANKGVRVCGDAAADPIALPVLLGLGARVFSLPTAALPLAAATVRQLDIAQLEPMAQRVLRAADANEVRALVLEELQESLAELWAEQGFDPAAH